MTVKTFTITEALKYAYDMTVEEFENSCADDIIDVCISYVQMDAKQESERFVKTDNPIIRENAINTLEAYDVIIKYLETRKGGTAE